MLFDLWLGGWVGVGGGCGVLGWVVFGVVGFGVGLG